MTPSLEGQTIGKYRVLEALGRGGMAQVFRAYHPQLDRYVAIKVLRSDLVEHEEFLGRFRREAHAVSGLRHPNIVQVFDFDAQDELYYMVMELLEGDTLRAKLNEYRARGQRMPLPEVLGILADVLDGLAYAHAEGIIHRDIKPANIMLTRRGQAVVTDFGIAQIVGSTQYTVSGALMGTLSYMAPEQGLRGHCDARSDIYSLGIVFYEMLTGYTPFDADTPLAILMKHLNDPLPLPSQIDPSLPAVLEPIVLKALAKDADDRYQSAPEMAAALRQAAESGLPGAPRPVVPPPGGMAAQAVYSGTSRRQIVDKRFADEDTDFDVAHPAQTGGDARTAATGTLDLLAGLPLANRVAVPLKPVVPILVALVIVGFFNSLAVWLIITTSWNVYPYGWSFEIFLLAGFLAAVGWGVQKPGVLIAALLIFGNAALLAYCSLTGRWGDWLFLWMLEPLILLAAILLPLEMGKRADAAPLTRAAGLLLSVVALALAGLVFSLGLLVRLFH
jgi:tRNA A-37 threonylcarbamoyl transferase component Bud32